MKTKLPPRSGRLAVILRATALALFIAALLAPGPLPAQTAAAPSVLVLYDNDEPWKWLGESYAIHLENLLSHFNARVTRKSLAGYVAGSMPTYSACFYLGSYWKETALPAKVRTDLEATTKPFVWVGINLWRYAWDLKTYEPSRAFSDRYGFQLVEHSEAEHGPVLYKGVELAKEPWDMGLSHITVTNPAKVQVLATCRDSGGTVWPYIVRSGNFWFVGDMPLLSTTFENRSLAFADLLHDMLGINHAENHRAFFRIEDVGPDADLPTLKTLGDALAAMDVPFMISVIPEYRDWTGFYNDGVPESYRLTKNSAVTKEIQRWVSEGGQVLQHGTTHQIDGLMNPYTGVSGDDYEFYRMSVDEQGDLALLGPVAGDSKSWAKRRVTQGQNILRNAGLTPVGWLTPHYLASAADYKGFAEIYPFACDRAIFFVTDTAGATQASELNAPFIYRDTYGLKRMPETIGYIDPWGWYDIQPPTKPEDLVRRARAMKVVRDGWAGFYYHWYLGPQDLSTTVAGLKSLGFTFVPLNGNLN